MFINLLDRLVDPKTNKDLSLHTFREFKGHGPREIHAGILVPKGERYYYPIKRGIPRLLIGYKDYEFEKKYWQEISKFVNVEKKGVMTRSERENIDTFSKHWDNLHSFSIEGASSFGVTQKQLVADLHRIFKIQPKSFSRKWIMDAGCGNGATSIAFLNTGANVIAMDITEGVDKCASFCRKNKIDKGNKLHLIQASVEHPPFRNKSFDLVFSHGVLHSTLSTRASFGKLASLVKKGGKFYVWVYVKDKLIYMRAIHIVNSVIRFLLNPVGSKGTYYFSLIWVRSAGLYHNLRFRLGSGNRSVLNLSFREHLLGTYDRFSDRYARKHTYEEVGGWFKSLGFDYKKKRSINSPPNYENYGVSILGIKR